MGGNCDFISNQIGIIYLCGNCGIHFNFLILQLFSRAILRGTGRDLSVHDLGWICDFISNQISIIYFGGNDGIYFKSNWEFWFWRKWWNSFQFFNPSIIFESNITRDRSRPVRTRFVRELWFLFHIKLGLFILAEIIEFISNQIGNFDFGGNCGIHFKFLILQLFSRAILRGTGRDLSVHDLGWICDFISNQISIIYFGGNDGIYFKSNWEFWFWREFWISFQIGIFRIFLNWNFV